MATASRGQRLLLIGLLTIAMMAPPLLLVMSGQAELASLFVYGGAIAMGGIFYSLRLAVGLSFLAGLAGIAAYVLSPYPIAGAVFFGLLTGSCALGARRGLHSPLLMVPVFVGFVLVAPPRIDGTTQVTAALLTGAVLTLGGLWMTGSARVLFGRSSKSLERQEFGPRAAVAYALLMAVVLGVAAWVVLSYAKYHQGAWLLLTLLIVMQPSAHDTITKSVQRLAGTLVGGAGALALSLIGLESPYTFVVAGILFFGAFSARFALKRPYWEFVTLLTPAVILLDAQGGDDVTTTEMRVGFTVIAVIVALAITVGIKALLLRKVPHGESA